MDQRFNQRTAGRASNPLAALVGQALTLLACRPRFVGAADFGFFLGQETQQDLTPCRVGFGGKEPPIVLDVHMSHSAIQGVVPVLGVP